MMSTTRIKALAEELAKVLSEIDGLKDQAKAIVETAREDGLNTKALRKVAKELITESAKLERQYDDEEQLDMFRAAVGIHTRKNIMMEAAE